LSSQTIIWSANTFDSIVRAVVRPSVEKIAVNG